MFIYDKVLLVQRIAAVAIRDAGGHALAGLHPGLENGLYLPVGIAGVKFVHNVQKRGKVVISLLVAVDTIVDGDKPIILLYYILYMFCLVRQPLLFFDFGIDITFSSSIIMDLQNSLLSISKT